MTTRVSVLAIALTLTACGASVRYAPIHNGDARASFIIDCRHGLVDCYSMANELCPGGYDVGDTQVGTSTTSSGSATRVGNAVIASGRSDVGASLIVACKGAADPAAATHAIDCMDDPSCATGYHCEFHDKSFGAKGRCEPDTAQATH